MRRDGDEIRRQGFDVAQLAGNAQQEVFGAMIEARQRANGVASIGTHAKFIDSPDVDGNAHSLV
jgi:hypothetical protein